MRKSITFVVIVLLIIEDDIRQAITEWLVKHWGETE